MRKTENIINRTGINKTECKKTGHSKENKIPGVKCTPKIELYLSNFKGALHWWNGSLFFLIIILGITLGIFAGCKNIFVPEPPATPEAAGPGGGITVPLRLFTGSARSVMPGMEALTWEITATSDGAEATVLEEYPDFMISFPSKGEWTIKVKGKSGTESDPKEIFTGEKTMDITGSTTSISIPLSPGDGMKSGNGTIELTMTVPTDVIKVMYKLDSDAVFAVLAPSGGSCSLNKAGVSAGPHTLSLYFLDGNGMTVYMCTETVNVWSGVTSNQWIKTNGEEYINDKGEFVITKEMVNEFVKTMGSVVFVDESVGENTHGTGSIYAPVNSVPKAVDILRKANGGKCNGTIMVYGETTIDREIVVIDGESLTVKGMRADASIKNTSGRVFKITGGSLTLEENITLTGTVTNDNGGAVYVNGGAFTMEEGSKITGSHTTANGGAVYVNGGAFTMESGSKITGSSASSGGGVYVADGRFTMNGTATLQGNTATTHGGGVHIFSGGTFTMNGGTIGGTAANTAVNGGGVFVSGGKFNMNGGTISENTVDESGGGVFVNDGNFTMAGGTIGGTTPNIATYGGGVHVFGGTFTVSGSSLTITGNTAHNVYLANGNTITIGDKGLTGGIIGVTAESVSSGNPVPITNEDVTGADRIFTSDVDTCSIVEYKGAVYLSGAETKYVEGAGSAEFLGFFKDAIDAVNNSTDGGTITLLKDIDGSNAVFENDSSQPQPITFTGGTETSPITLDLNGYTINRALGTAQVDGTVISVSGALTLKDSTGSGKITGGNNNNSTISGTWGGGVCVQDGAFFTMVGGNISYNFSEIGGGGVYVCNGGSFTMTGGTIGGSGPNDGNMNTSTSYGGGGVFVNGEFTMSSGTITGNITDANGGGVAVTEHGTFTMSGTAVISANKASYGSGGGVYVFGNFTMTGGTIGGTGGGSPNSAQYGGGVYVNGGSSIFTVTGGTISGNTATQNGGGVYVSSTGSFTLGPSSAESSPVISGNTKTDDSPNNVYLDNGKTLFINGILKKPGVAGNIGVSMATPQEFTSGWSTSGLTESTFFFSDDTQYNVKVTTVNGQDELCLVNSNLIFVKGE